MTARKFVVTNDLSRRVALVAGLGGLLAALPGCQGIVGTPAVSLVRVIDTSAHAGGVDVYQGSSSLAYNLDLGTVTSYIAVVPGAYTINADHAGTGQHLVRQHGAFGANAQSTVLIGDSPTGMRETILRDQTQPAPAGQIALRFFDESTRAGAVDVYLIPTGSTLEQVRPLLVNVAFGRNTGYLSAVAGTYTLVALPAGTTPETSANTSYTGASVAYASGSAHTIVLIDQAQVSAPGLQVIVADDYETPSS